LRAAQHGCAGSTSCDFVDDGPLEPVGIYRHIGRRPTLAFGNSDGDRQMLLYTMAGNGPAWC